MSWQVDGKTNAGSVLSVTWREHGGPKIASLDERGFGSALIEKSLAGAKVERRFDENGFICTIELTLKLTGRIRRKRRLAIVQS